MTYHPFGGVTGFTFGNSQAYTRAVDQDGRIASYSLGSASYSVGFDAASRIMGIAEVGNPSNANSYGYDALDRLTSAVLPSTSYGYSYDAVGNRVTKAAGANTDTYAYGGSSNRLVSVMPNSRPVRNFTFDANGSTNADGLNTYAYDTRGRMVQAVSSIGTTSYQVNALGQRVRKTNSLGDTIYHYDTRGRLIAETDPAGSVVCEFIYLGDIPVGVAQGPLAFIHVDHLNTPRLVADAAGTTVWRWDQAESFGNNPADEDPDANSVAFDLPLRLPGQRYDAETGLHYNYLRDYDPSIGRYAESDPIGLRGGFNTYVYVAADPLRHADVFGLAESQAFWLFPGGGLGGAIAVPLHRPSGIGVGAAVGFEWRKCCGPINFIYNEMYLAGDLGLSWSSPMAHRYSRHAIQDVVRVGPLPKCLEETTFDKGILSVNIQIGRGNVHADFTDGSLNLGVTGGSGISGVVNFFTLKTPLFKTPTSKPCC